jgi:hypothetical protein
MDERIINGKPAGDSKTGRKLFTQLQSAGLKILAAGSSDWIVYSTEGYYPQGEAYFLHYIIHTIHEELKTIPGSIPIGLMPGLKSAMPRLNVQN